MKNVFKIIPQNSTNGLMIVYEINKEDALTMSVTIFGHGVDFLVGQNLHVLATGSTVKLVGPD